MQCFLGPRHCLWARGASVPILQVRSLRHRRVKCLFQGLTCLTESGFDPK